MTTTLTHRDGHVIVTSASAGGHHITVNARPGVFVPVRQWTTRYSMELIEHVLRVKGAAYLCDEIMRDESERYVQSSLHWDILGHCEPSSFSGRRILDFGSGSGSSSMVLSRMFPHCSIVGIELEAEFVELARHRARFYNVEDRVNFTQSPDPNSVPPDLGRFDYVLLSAVFEHLLPRERKALLPVVWSCLKPGGVLFLDQTPYRWSPMESHTTGLPLINYLPDWLTLECARRLSKRIRGDESWEELLRKGIRGGSTSEVLGIIRSCGGKPEVLKPSRLGLSDHIDLWYQKSVIARPSAAKGLIRGVAKCLKAATGASVVPGIALAIRRAD